jgi:16S rRNA (guanine966-N2)-methyltransferase
VRVISGTERGRRLVGPKGLETRPATDRLKEALFNMLFDVQDEAVLDLYAGTGGLAIEALSRGAAHAVLIESSPAAVVAIERNIGACGFEDRATVIRADVTGGMRRAACRERAPFQVVFCDPPYEVGNAELKGVADDLAALGLIDASSRLAFERRTGDEAPPLPGGWRWVRERAYGQTTLHLAETGEDV